LWMIKLSKEPQRESCFLCGLLQHVVWISESEETIPVLRYLISEGRHLIRLPHGSALSGKHNRPSSGGSSWNASFRVLSICAFDCSDGSMPRMYRKPWRDSGLDSDGSGPGQPCSFLLQGGHQNFPANNPAPGGRENIEDVWDLFYPIYQSRTGNME